MTFESQLLSLIIRTLAVHSSCNLVHYPLKIHQDVGRVLGTCSGWVDSMSATSDPVGSLSDDEDTRNGIPLVTVSSCSVIPHVYTQHPHHHFFYFYHKTSLAQHNHNTHNFLLFYIRFFNTKTHITKYCWAPLSGNLSVIYSKGTSFSKWLLIFLWFYLKYNFS